MWLHVEPTSRCNAWCPGCPRNKFGYGLTDFVIEDLDPKVLQNTIEEYNINSVQMCGNLGDPCAAKNIDEAFSMLESMEHDPKEVLKAVEESYMTRLPKSEKEEDKVDIR